jgi:hypothetical protein
MAARKKIVIVKKDETTEEEFIQKQMIIHLSCCGLFHPEFSPTRTYHGNQKYVRLLENYLDAEDYEGTNSWITAVHAFALFSDYRA